MKIWCFDERTGAGWGRMLLQAANARGTDCELFTDAAKVAPGDYAFMHVRQHAPHLRQDQATAEVVAAKATLVPDISQVRLYEDKLVQAECYAGWMPETRVYRDGDSIVPLAYPFISKAREGSSSVNVRMIQNREQAQREIDLAFSTGIPTRRGIQKGYLIWQEFLQANPGDYRVIAIGRQRMVLRRWNREDVPFASGSGSFTPIRDYSDEVCAVLEVANEFFADWKTGWCGLDLVQDPETNHWKILESTIGWTFEGYLKCRFLGTDKFGCDTWTVLLDEIEAGAFG